MQACTPGLPSGHVWTPHTSAWSMARVPSGPVSSLGTQGGSLQRPASSGPASSLASWPWLPTRHLWRQQLQQQQQQVTLPTLPLQAPRGRGRPARVASPLSSHSLASSSPPPSDAFSSRTSPASPPPGQPQTSAASPSPPHSTSTPTLGQYIKQVSAAIHAALDRVGVGPLERRMIIWALQLGGSLVSVVLYVWSTYSPAAPGGPRYCLDVALCVVFACEFLGRLRTSAGLSPLLVVDLLSFLPTLMEAALLALDGNVSMGLRGAAAAAGVAPGTNLWGALHLPDLKWLRILRSLRILRLVLLSGNLPVMKLSTSALLSGSVNARLLQLVASVVALLFTSASLVHLAERMPFHDAFYFVVTSLTTVGYGDVTVKTWLGRLVVIGMIMVGVVLIPVRTGQLWSQLVSQRVTAGRDVPAGRPWVLLSGRITDVRSFSDLFTEFSAQLAAQNHQGGLPADVHLLCLGSRPGNELLAFQELHDRRLTLVEGSVLRPADLVRYRAASASAILVMANRFSPDVDTEDLDVLFRVWAIKSFTKCVPLTVQVLRASSLGKVKPFLDPANDTITSTQLTRHRLLALSCMCPGASTLLCNLLQTAQTTPDLEASATRGPGEPAPQLAGRAWLAEYARGCGNELFVIRAGAGLDGVPWLDAVIAAFRQQHVLLIGVNHDRPQGGRRRGGGCLSLNPSKHVISRGEQLLVIASSRRRAEAISGLSVISVTSEQCIEVPWYQATLRWALDYRTSKAGGNTASTSTGPSTSSTSTSSSGGSDVPQPGTSAPLSLNCDSHPSGLASADESVQRLKPTGAAPAQRHLSNANASSAAHSRFAPLDSRAPYLGLEDRTLAELSGHVILSGSQDSFVEFARTLHSMWGQWRPTDPQWWPSAHKAVEEEPGKLPLVVLHPNLDASVLLQLRELGPVYEVRGLPANPAALARANAKKARCLVYMASTHRPGTVQVGEEADYGTTSGAALRADAEALLTCYGVGEGDPAPPLVREEGWAWSQARGATRAGGSHASGSTSTDSASLSSYDEGHTEVQALPVSAAGVGIGSDSGAVGGAAGQGLTLATSSFEQDPFYIERGPPHTVCELAFTSSVRFLQPGLLLQGASTYDAAACEALFGQPRNSWVRRLEAEAAAAQQGLVQYQTNVYYCAGRVVLPAHMDTFICQAFIKHRLLEDFMSELCRDAGGPGGALLRQLPVPPQLCGRPYRDLFQHLVDCHNVIPLGLLRPKVSENATWRLDYVSSNPAWEDVVGLGDRVFVLRPGDEEEACGAVP